jgi:ferredoxin-like protein FixX
MLLQLSVFSCIIKVTKYIFVHHVVSSQLTTHMLLIFNPHFDMRHGCVCAWQDSLPVGRLYYRYHIYMASHLCVYDNASSEWILMKSVHHKHHNHKASPQNAHACEQLNFLCVRNFYHTLHIYKYCLLCGFCSVNTMYSGEKKFSCILRTDVTYLQYV